MYVFPSTLQVPPVSVSVPDRLWSNVSVGSAVPSAVIAWLNTTSTLNVPVPAFTSVTSTSLAVTLVTVGFSVSTLNSTLGV